MLQQYRYPNQINSQAIDAPTRLVSYTFVVRTACVFGNETDITTFFGDVCALAQDWLNESLLLTPAA